MGPILSEHKILLENGGGLVKMDNKPHLSLALRILSLQHINQNLSKLPDSLRGLWVLSECTSALKTKKDVALRTPIAPHFYAYLNILTQRTSIEITKMSSKNCRTYPRNATSPPCS